jgi:hypothetical protein
MPISFALLLCIPIGFVFFLIARFSLRYLVGHYERPERRAALIFGLFGSLLIPTIWTMGCLEEEFPTISGTVISYLLFLVEGLAIVELIRRSYTKRRDDERELKERAEP